MDEPYLLAAAGYVESNPVRAQLVASAGDWPWSSARAHLAGRDDRLVEVAALLAMIGDWNGFLNSAIPEEELRNMRRHGRTGRPLGDDTFLGRLEEMAGRILNPQKRGPKPKGKANSGIPLLAPLAALQVLVTHGIGNLDQAYRGTRHAVGIAKERRAWEK